MRIFFFGVVLFGLTACGGGGNEVNTDTMSATRDTSFSGSLMNTDTTSVIGSNGIGEGQMQTERPVEGANSSGK